MKYRMLFILIIFAFSTKIQAQELLAEVSINTPQLQLADPKIFKSLETAIEEFYNNNVWTEDEFEQEERIKFQIQMTITTEISENSFLAEMAIQSSRPIFNSSQETPLLNHVDKDIAFNYDLFQPLIYTKNAFNDNLTSILSFYAYIILGLDYDSFSPFGGEPHFLTAQEIMNTVPATVAANVRGWRQLDGNVNRYWLVENLLSPRVRPFRQAFYEYHMQGKDIMYENVEGGRAKLAECLETVAKVSRDYPNAMIIQLFSNAKSNEIIEIFKLGTRSEKLAVKKSMSNMDPSNSNKYERIGN